MIRWHWLPRYPETVSGGGQGPGDLRAGKKAGQGTAQGASVSPPSGGTPDDDTKSVAEVKVQRISGQGVGGGIHSQPFPAARGSPRNRVLTSSCRNGKAFAE